MKHHIRIATLFLFTAFYSFAAQAIVGKVATDISTEFINIKTDFDGSILTMYGVKDVDADVIVILRGPELDMKVRKKEKTLLGWRFTKELIFNNIPSFYSVVSTKPIQGIVNQDDLKKYEIGRENLKVHPKKIPQNINIMEFKKAAFRNLHDKNVFTGEAAPAHMINDEFFKINFDLPHNVPQGFYIAQVLTVENKKIVGQQWHNIFVSQVGMTAFISNWAVNKSLLYGILCAIFAIIAGLISNRVKRIL